MKNESTIMLASLRIDIIKQIVENDEYNANAFKRHFYARHTREKPQKHADKGVLEHLKTKEDLMQIRLIYFQFIEIQQ